MVERPDRKGSHRTAYQKNRKRVFASQSVCGICGHPVDFELKAPHPMSPVADHIVPIAKGGHPSAIENLQLAHWTCNRTKSDKIFKNEESMKPNPKVIGNRNLPHSVDWANYKVK